MMDFLEWLSNSFKSIVDGIIKVLPSSPIVYLTQNDSISKYMSYVNWFIPVYLWISILETWLVAVTVYYVVQVVLRWVKVVE